MIFCFSKMKIRFCGSFIINAMKICMLIIISSISAKIIYFLIEDNLGVKEAISITPREICYQSIRTLHETQIYEGRIGKHDTPKYSGENTKANDVFHVISYAAACWQYECPPYTLILADGTAVDTTVCFYYQIERPEGDKSKEYYIRFDNFQNVVPYR